jgi:hypothetical protein
MTVSDSTRLQQLVLDFPNMPHHARLTVLAAVDSVTETGTGGWWFMMVDFVRYKAVQTWLNKHSRRPLKGSLMWAWCLELADRYEGEVRIDRTKLCEELEVRNEDLSRLLSDLVKCNALMKERDGRTFRYYLNPRVATNLPLEPREIAQRAAPEIAGVSNRYPFTELRIVA